MVSSFLLGIFDKFKYYILIGVAALVWLFQLLWKAKQSGKQEVINKVNKETQRVKDEWSKIDNTSTSIDDDLRVMRDHQRKRNS